MASKKFSEEEMRELRASSYVLDVSPSIVHFSAEFKAIFWEGILAGKEPRKIVEELGIDPDALGENRLRRNMAFAALSEKQILTVGWQKPYEPTM